MAVGPPLWKRGVRGDFVKIFNSIGVVLNPSVGRKHKEYGRL